MKALRAGARRSPQPLNDVDVHRRNVAELAWTREAIDSLLTVYGAYCARDLHGRLDAARAAVAESLDHADSGTTAPTPVGRQHVLSAIPVFAGIPVAAIAMASAAVRSRDYRWRAARQRHA